MQAVRWHARGDVRVEVVPPPPPPRLRDEPAKHVKILVQPEEPA